MDDMTGIDPDLTPQQNVAKLATEFHTLKGNLAVNTSLTREIADAMHDMTATLAKIDVEKLAVMVEGYDSIRGGVRVLGWLERPAKWLAAMIGLAGAVWAVWHSNGGSK